MKFQDPVFSYMHSMRDGLTKRNGLTQSIDEAKEARDTWVSNNISEFQMMGASEEYRYVFLGYAIHAMSDEHSP